MNKQIKYINLKKCLTETYFNNQKMEKKIFIIRYFKKLYNALDITKNN